MSMYVANNVDLRNRIVGDFPLDWSEDNCIAAATSKNILLYELNPLYDIDCSEMYYKVQAVPMIEALEYDAGAKKLIFDYDMLCSVSSRGSAYPDFEIYRMHLDLSVNKLHGSEEIGDTGFRAVQFSPLGCAVGGGTILAVLTAGHQLQLFSRISDGTSIQWKNVFSLTDILINVLEENNQYYPKVEFPSLKTTSQKTVEKQHAACITCIAWCQTSCNENAKDKFILFSTGTKNNFLILWKLRLPISSNSKADIVNYIKTNISGIKTISWLKSKTEKTKTFNVAVGGVDGAVVCIKVDQDGNSLIESEVWKDRDHLSVSAINWSEAVENEEITNLLVSKGSILLYMAISPNLEKLSQTVLSAVHILPIVSIQCSDKSSSWVTTSRDGQLAKVTLSLKSSTEVEDSKPQLHYEIMSGQTTQSSTVFHETTHFHVVSPNQAFIATLRSRPKVSLTIIVENSAYIEIKTLKSGMDCFHSLCTQSDRDEEMKKIDLVESVRLHLLRGDFFADEAENIVLKTSIERFLRFGEVANTKLRLRWILLKICSNIFQSSDTDYKKLLLDHEKIIASKQMMKVLKQWFINPHCDEDDDSMSRQLPIKTIVSWLTENKNLLNQEDLCYMVSLQNTKKFSQMGREVCKITGEFLTMSEDCKSAITESTSMTWCRCCLTFSSLHDFRIRKCEISNSRAKNLEELNRDEDSLMNSLLRDCSIYSGLPML